jgi:flagellar assembly factor FliW
VGKKSTGHTVEKALSHVLKKEVFLVFWPRESARIIITSSRYGSIEISKDMVISCPDGVMKTPGPGDFVVVGLKRFAPFLVLVSVNAPNVSYPIVDPRSLVPDYEPMIPGEELRRIGSPGSDSIQIVTTVKLDMRRKVTILDLRHPILINVKRRLAKQVELSDYPRTFEIPAALLRQ